MLEQLRELSGPVVGPLLDHLRQAKRESDAWVEEGRRIMHWPRPVGWKAGLGRLHERLTVPNQMSFPLMHPGKL